MPELRTQSAGARVIEKEYAEMEKLAESRGLKVEWCRETLLARVNGQEPRAATDCAGNGQVRKGQRGVRSHGQIRPAPFGFLHSLQFHTDPGSG